MKNEGWAIHCHHNILVEWCYDFNGRVNAIKKDKPVNEKKIRLKLFKMLPKEVGKDIPHAIQEAYKAWQEAYKACEKAYKAWQEAYKAWHGRRHTCEKAYKARQEAYKAWQEAYKAWEEADKQAFHEKWCGCSEWNGKEIIFWEG